MNAYTTDMTRNELEALRAELRAHELTVDVWGDPEADLLTVALSEAAIDCLQWIPVGVDWHCSEGNIYAGGATYPLRRHVA